MKRKTYPHDRGLDGVRELVEREAAPYARTYDLSVSCSAERWRGTRSWPTVKVIATFEADALRLSVDASWPLEGKIFDKIDAMLRKKL